MTARLMGRIFAKRREASRLQVVSTTCSTSGSGLPTRVSIARTTVARTEGWASHHPATCRGSNAEPSAISRSFRTKLAGTNLPRRSATNRSSPKATTRNDITVIGHMSGPPARNNSHSVFRLPTLIDMAGPAGQCRGEPGQRGAEAHFTALSKASSRFRAAATYGDAG